MSVTTVRFGGGEDGMRFILYKIPFTASPVRNAKSITNAR